MVSMGLFVNRRVEFHEGMRMAGEIVKKDSRPLCSSLGGLHDAFPMDMTFRPT